MKGHAILSFIYNLLPPIVVGVSVWFFCHAFQVTTAQDTDADVLPVADYRIQGTSNSTVAYVTIPAEQWNRMGCIAEKEHARFRAELGTWLSIFGLLSIIATVLVPVATNRVNLADLKSKLAELNKKYEELDKTRAELNEKLAEIDKKVDRVEERINDQEKKSDEVESVVLEQESKAKEVVGIEVVKHDGGEDLAKIIEECRLKRTDIIYGLNKDTVPESVVSMVGLLKRVNDEVLVGGQGEVIKLALDFINTINIYLGRNDVKAMGFEEAFDERMRYIHPLTLTVDQVLKKYEGGNLSIYRGFYNAMFNRQSNERAI